MMKIIICVMLILACNSGYGQNTLSSVFEKRVEYVNVEIPQCFKTYYSNFILVEDSLLERILEETSHFASLGVQDTLLIFELNIFQDAVIVGGIISGNGNLAYRIDVSNSVIEFYTLDVENWFTAFEEDVRNWNMFVTNRSFYGSSIAGGGYVLCSRVIGSDCCTVAFAEYDKNCNVIYLKERMEDNWAPKRLFLE